MRDDVAGVGLASNSGAALRGAVGVIENDSVRRQDLREISLLLGIGRHADERRIGLAVFQPFPCEEPEEFVFAIGRVWEEGRGRRQSRRID